MTAPAIYIHEFAVLCALGDNTDAVERNLLSPAPKRIDGRAQLTDGRVVPVGEVSRDSAIDLADTRCNQLADRCLATLQPSLDRHRDAVGPERLAVVVGTSTSGVREGGDGFRTYVKSGHWPEGYRFGAQELGDVAAHVAQRAGARGPAYGISTACTSGAKALASAARLIASGFCDVAIAGGIDSLCDLTLNGFAALESPIR